MGNLKKLIVLMFTFFSVVAVAEEKSMVAKSFRNSIVSFLREEGFSPFIDNDGDVAFKKEGMSYWIDVSGDKPFYVRFYVEGFDIDDANLAAIQKAVNEVNMDIRAIKCCYNTKSVILTVEFYTYATEDFKYIFYPYYNILQSSRNAIQEAYSKYDSSGSYSSSSSASTYSSSTSASNNRSSWSTSSSGSNVTSTPHMRKLSVDGDVWHTDGYKYYVSSIEFNKTGTIVNYILVPKSYNTSCASRQGAYIEDCDTGKKYSIITSSIGMAPNSTKLSSLQSRNYSEHYPAIPSSVKRINIWDGRNYVIRDYKL